MVSADVGAATMLYCVITTSLRLSVSTDRSRLRWSADPPRTPHGGDGPGQQLKGTTTFAADHAHVDHRSPPRRGRCTARCHVCFQGGRAGELRPGCVVARPVTAAGCPRAGQTPAGSRIGDPSSVITLLSSVIAFDSSVRPMVILRGLAFSATGITSRRTPSW